MIKIAAIGAFAIMDTCLKILSESYGAFQVTFFRGVAALPFVIALVAWKGSLAELKTNLWYQHLLRSVLAISMLAAIVYAFRIMPLADAYSIFYAAPIFVTLLSIYWLKEVVGWHRWGALVIGMGAVLFMFQPSGVGFNWAVAACLYSTFIYAVLVIMLKVMSKTDSTLSLTFYFTLFLSVGAAALAITDWQPFQPKDILLIILLGFSGAIAQLLITEAYSLAPASSLAPFEYSSIVWAIAIGWLIWGDIPGGVMLTSSSILVLTGIYILHREKLHHSEPTPVVLTPSSDADPILDKSHK